MRRSVLRTPCGTASVSTTSSSPLVLLGRHEAELDRLDVETLVNYAEYMALNPGRLWQEAGVEQKGRSQRFVAPSGLTWDDERFGAVATGLFFGRLEAASGEAGGLVGLQGLSWNRLRPLLQELEALRAAS